VTQVDRHVCSLFLVKSLTKQDRHFSVRAIVRAIRATNRADSCGFQRINLAHVETPAIPHG
jgi:hypothetical protein